MIAWAILLVGLAIDLLNLYGHAASRLRENRRPSSILLLPLLLYGIGVGFNTSRLVHENVLLAFASLTCLHVFAIVLWPRILDRFLLRRDHSASSLGQERGITDEGVTAFHATSSRRVVANDAGIEIELSPWPNRAVYVSRRGRIELETELAGPPQGIVIYLSAARWMDGPRLSDDERAVVESHLRAGLPPLTGEVHVL